MDDLDTGLVLAAVGVLAVIQNTEFKIKRNGIPYNLKFIENIAKLQIDVLAANTNEEINDLLNVEVLSDYFMIWGLDKNTTKIYCNIIRKTIGV